MYYSLCLDEWITNDHGNLKWAKNGNFSAFAHNVCLVDNGKTLSANLAKGEEQGGGFSISTLDLGEGLSNDHGNFSVVTRVISGRKQPLDILIG
jgi:CVNH domain